MEPEHERRCHARAHNHKDPTTTLSRVAEHSAMTFTLLGLDDPRLVRTGIVTGNYFSVMGLRPEVGRVLDTGDDGENAAPVMLLTYDFWGRVFGFDPTVVSRRLQVNGRTLEVVGVLTPAPPYPERTDVFVNMVSSPHHLAATMTEDRWHRMTEVFARLAPGATIEMARAEISALAASVRTEYPEAYDEGAGYDVRVTALQDQLTSGARPTLWILLGTAAFVLVIACANVANLTLTRVVTRERELVTRAALGATGGMLRRGLLIENLLLSAAGAALGVGLAWLGFDALVAFIGRFTSRATEITLDGRVFGFATAVATLAALLFASLPRVPTASGTPGAPASGRTTDGGAGKRVQRGLVVAQVAVSFVLLVGAGLMGRTFLAVQSVDPGFETDRVLTMEIPTDFGARLPDDTRNYYETILRQVRALPGVRDAGLGTTVPLAASRNEFPLMELNIEGHVVPPGQPTPLADFRPVSPGYFRTLGVTPLAGRLLEETDRPESQRVVVVNQSLATRFFPNQDPVGKRLVWGDLMSWMGDEWYTIVGVVADSKNYGLDRDVPEAVFHPFAQVSMASTLFVRTTGAAEAVASPIRQLIRRLDPSQPIENVLTLNRSARTHWRLDA